jgi:hypothetical protein
MLRYIALSLVGLLSGAVLAQQAPRPEGVLAPLPAAASAEPPKAAISLEERLPGDHWAFEVRDEITGTVSTQTNIVTEVTPTDVSVRYNRVRADKTSYEGFDIYDQSWNGIRSGSWQYFPYNGTNGVQPPLTVGKTWTFQYKAVDGRYSTTWNVSGTSKVVGQETVTTRAGTFETLKIETTTASSDFKDPTLTLEQKIQTWYAPAIAHWVKRTWIARNNDRLSHNNTYELTEFSRK